MKTAANIFFVMNILLKLFLICKSPFSQTAAVGNKLTGMNKSQRNTRLGHNLMKKTNKQAKKKTCIEQNVSHNFYVIHFQSSPQ